MAKRRGENILLQDSSSKRYRPSLCSVDIKAESMATMGGVSAPSLLALLGSRCRKRPYGFDDDEKIEDTTPYLRTTLRDTKQKQAANILTLPISSFQDHRSISTHTRKRPREGNADSDKATHTANEKTQEDKSSEDCTYNSFQYWRVPLPELDLSLLEDTIEHSQTKEKPKVCDSFSDTMEI